MTGAQWQVQLQQLSDTDLLKLERGLNDCISVDLFMEEYADTGICIIQLYVERERKNRGL